jgi:hypothetical protein
MIPKHLQEKSAVQIVGSIKGQICGIDKFVYDRDYNRYIILLEKLLVLAVRDTLMNADGKVLCDGDYALMGSEAEVRALAFLNTVVPKESTT